MNFVTCNLIGPSGFLGFPNYGLGNQMFQIATAISYAKENNIKAIFPMLKNRERYGNYTDNIFKNLNLTEFDESEIEIEFHQPSFTYCEIPKSRKIRLHGYFQTEKFFISNKKLIDDYFQPDELTKNYIKEKYANILEDSISIHLRFGDYIKLKKHHPLLSLTNYYENIVKKNKRKNILVFSDDINAAKKVKILKKYNTIFMEGESEIIDMYTMSLCNDNAIANSTFSWWGAWLNRNPNKTVYYPKIWFGPKLKHYKTIDLFPESWEKIDCKYNSKFKSFFNNQN